MDTYEKKYKEALERARQFSEHPLCEDSGNIVEYIFPELEESEDERIRKWLEETIEGMPENSIDFRDVRRIDVLHWLEKQKPTKWDENDEGIFTHCIGAIHAADYYTLEDKNEMENWLKSLKQRMEEQQ